MLVKRVEPGGRRRRRTPRRCRGCCSLGLRGTHGCGGVKLRRLGRAGFGPGIHLNGTFLVDKRWIIAGSELSVHFYLASSVDSESTHPLQDPTRIHQNQFQKSNSTFHLGTYCTCLVPRLQNGKVDLRPAQLVLQLDHSIYSTPHRFFIPQ